VTFLFAGKTGWVRRIAIGLVGLTLAGYATRDALVQSAARTRPDFALGLDGTNATALNANFRALLAAQPEAPMPLDRWAARARAALLAAPLSAAMVRMVSADPAQKQSQETLQLAERLSRRDALTQLALTETAVSAGEVDVALLHYDHALSIYPDMRTILFPLLANGLAEPAIQRGVVALARRQRPWIDSFFAFAVQSSNVPDALAATLSALDRGPGALGSARAHEAALAKRLVDNGRYALARRVAMREAGGDAAWIDRPGFAPATWATPAQPLTWSTTEDDSVEAQLTADNQVAVSILPGRSGLAIFRVLVLAPGTYRFTAGAAAPQDIAATGGHWSVVCLPSSGRLSPSLAEIPVNLQQTVSAARVTVPASCGAVRLGFTIDNVNGSSDAGVLLHDLALSPVR
jgi:hypothetical protein